MSTEMKPAEAMEEGRRILEPVLGASGWRFEPGPIGTSSGGDFAQANFIHDDRRLELHVRRSLGLVKYHIGEVALSHEAYMEALVGRRGASKYPGFSADPIDGFRDLAADLQAHCMDFVAGPGDQFRQCAERARDLAKAGGFKALTRRQDA
jgi:hypothetical protein